MGYKTFVAGEEALAADVNAYLMGQTVARFASAAARTSQLAAPAVNQLSMLDTRPGVVQYWTGSAWSDEYPLIQQGGANANTDANGLASVTFPTPFGAVPIVQVTPYWAAPIFVQVANATASVLTVKVWYFSGGVAASIAFAYNWLAIGAPGVTPGGKITTAAT